MSTREKDKYQASQAFHDHAEVYDAWFENSLVYEIELAALESLHTEMREPGLEIGVGPGRFSQELGVVFGIDPAGRPLKLASARGIKCCQAFGEELPVKNRSIGTVYLLFTLCFVADPQRLLCECFRVLKEDGLLVVGMVPSGSKWGRNITAKKNDGHPLYEFSRVYDIEKVKKWLADAHLSIVEFRSTLYQAPECVEQKEVPRNIPDEQAGFVVIVARKNYV